VLAWIASSVMGVASNSHLLGSVDLLWLAFGADRQGVGAELLHDSTAILLLAKVYFSHLNYSKSVTLIFHILVGATNFLTNKISVFIIRTLI
jgi:hypothetical protein